jgi:hypothetical protein
LRICCIWLVDSVESVMMHGLAKPKGTHWCWDDMTQRTVEWASRKDMVQLLELLHCGGQLLSVYLTTLLTAKIIQSR